MGKDKALVMGRAHRVLSGLNRIGYSVIMRLKCTIVVPMGPGCATPAVITCSK